MCTLTYQLTETGYGLFFNRDEQRSRAHAIPPAVNTHLNAIYPIDPVGKGTWLAVHKSGLSLALLNNYQAERKQLASKFTSRGELILKLLNDSGNVIKSLKALSLTSYQPFQLCVFPKALTRNNERVHYFLWDGDCLTEHNNTLPVTSSSVEYAKVYESRSRVYQETIVEPSATSEQFIEYHQSQQKDGVLGVKMSRLDAQTVSFSYISVGKKIQFSYRDYLNNSEYLVDMEKE
ncbi:hypothetical protein CW745_10760 [Psychromonas sp. psych-6C06]|uniref:NRDE family protein n=1 Tax=Psychromonas sp. psych-6C06 TaxID=2058089 RepID=UPI000C32C2C0|nr:NRDE family protein [Psychromonas sp. psych-6C06]PKF61787.1 hypothetical protein CW745_10760 [Psychromonas sp. psych-6C06]